MTLTKSVLNVFQNIKSDEREIISKKFFDRWKNNNIVLDSWFAFCSSLEIENYIDNLENHKRSGKNYQWKTHLMARTQDHLNKELNEILDYWEFK